MIAKKKEKDDFSYRKNNWGFRGRDFTLPLKDGKGVVNMHQSVSGTLYFVDKNGSLRKVTQELLDRLAAEAPTNTRPIMDDSDEPTPKADAAEGDSQ